MSGVWLNPTNNIKVQITAVPGSTSAYTASCIGPVGWKDATITVHPGDGTAKLPQGTASISIPSGSAGADTTGPFSTLADGCPPCTRIGWESGGAWELEPWADRNKPKPAPPAPPAPPGIPHVQAFSEGNGVALTAHLVFLWTGLNVVPLFAGMPATLRVTPRCSQTSAVGRIPLRCLCLRTRLAPPRTRLAPPRTRTRLAPPRLAPAPPHARPQATSTGTRTRDLPRALRS